jgi:iron complex outermembrane recepter protein
MNKILLTGLMSAASATAFAQIAKTDSAADPLAEVVVTGTLIRGSAPNGSPVVTLDNAAILATGATNTADLLATVPALTRVCEDSRARRYWCCSTGIAWWAILRC